MKYSKTKVRLKIEDRTYTLKKLGARDLNIEGFKLVRIFAPSVGAGIDGYRNQDDFGILDGSNTVAAMLQLLSENLSSEHYTELTDMLLGSLSYDGDKLEDWSDHFDTEEFEGDFLEVLVWAFKENFYSFFTKSTILVNLMEKAKSIVLPMQEDNESKKESDKER